MPKTYFHTVKTRGESFQIKSCDVLCLILTIGCTKLHFFFSMNGSTLHPKRTFIQRIRFSFFVIIDLESIPITGQNSQFSQKLITCIKSTISGKFQSPDLPAKGKTINVLLKEEHIIKRSKDYFEEVYIADSVNEAVITQIVKTLDNNSDPPSIEEVEMAQYNKAKKKWKSRGIDQINAKLEATTL